MNRALSQLLTALLCLAASNITFAAEPIQIRVLSYNIHHGEGTDGVLSLERIAQVIRTARPDLVALQEVDCGTRRTNQVDQPAELAKLTKLEAVFGDNIPYDGGRYGNAVLSRFRILRSENHPLPQEYKGEQRGILEVEVQPPACEQSLLVFATHFDYRPNSKERLLSAGAANKLVAERASRAALLAGDLNAEPTSETLQILSRHWSRAGGQITPTFPAGEPQKQIDYVLYHPAQPWKVISTEVLHEPAASDHRPLLAVLELANE